MKDEEKLEAIRTILLHPQETDKQKLNIINKIWYVIHEDRVVDFEV